MSSSICKGINSRTTATERHSSHTPAPCAQRRRGQPVTGTMAELPTETVTFLFTDIEGSTRLWEQQSQTMRQAIARHDALLRDSIEINSGHVFKTIGDAFCA